MKQKRGQAQRRGIRYEKKKAKAHKAKYVGGVKGFDAQKGKQKIEIKNWSRPVPKPEVVKAKRRGVKKFISKKGFTEPALKYGKTKRMKLYRGKKRLI